MILVAVVVSKHIQIILGFVPWVAMGARIVYKLDHANKLVPDQPKVLALTMVTMIANAVHQQK